MSGIVGSAGSKSGIIGETEIDFETGSWTGTITGTTSNPTSTAAGNGRYTKIGKQGIVNVSLTIPDKNTSGAAGNARVTGLPFTSFDDGSGEFRSVISVALYNGFTWGGHPGSRNHVGIIEQNTTMIQLLATIGDDVWVAITHDAGATTYIWLSGMYFARGD